MSRGVVEAIDSTPRAPHVDDERMHAYFGRCHRVGGAEVLERIAREGITTGIQTRGISGKELAYGHHRRATEYRAEVLTKAKTGVALGRYRVFPVAQAKGMVGLRISPVGMVEGKEKLRVIHDLTCRCGATVRKERPKGNRE